MDYFKVIAKKLQALALENPWVGHGPTLLAHVDLPGFVSLALSFNK